MSEQSQAFKKCPQAWIEMREIEELSFDKATWIPLAAQKVDLLIASAR